MEDGILKNPENMNSLLELRIDSRIGTKELVGIYHSLGFDLLPEYNMEEIKEGSLVRMRMNMHQKES